MSTSVFESYYAKDWGSKARAARNDRRSAIVRLQGNAAGVVRGRVDHPVFGPGFDLHYRRPSGAGVDDLRATPDGLIPQMPPSLAETEERWQETPTWLS